MIQTVILTLIAFDVYLTIIGQTPGEVNENNPLAKIFLTMGNSEFILFACLEFLIILLISFLPSLLWYINPNLVGLANHFKDFVLTAALIGHYVATSLWLFKLNLLGENYNWYFFISLIIISLILI